MRRLLLLITALLLFSGFQFTTPVAGQGGEGFQWPAPLHPGTLSSTESLMPPANAMPTLPLEEPLIEHTLFFNAEAFGIEDYRVLNLTFDTRRHAYNITTELGALPVSPNGQYVITTVSAAVPGLVTCGIVDILTGQQVDQFQTDGACSGVEWSPDSTQLLLTTTDQDGNSALAIRHNGQNTVFRPVPTAEADLGGGAVSGDRVYIINGWLSNSVFSFDLGLQGNLTEELFTHTDDLETAFPALNLTTEMAAESIVLWRPAQPLGQVTRGLWMTHLETGDTFRLAPAGHTAIIGDVAPDGNAVVYWAATESNLGPVHPLRLVIYLPETDDQIVLLQFDGLADRLVTRPGLVIWNPEGIYFHLSQQDENNALPTGTYHIQPDGSELEYITEHLLMGSLD